jgi:small subunit ribosomal protein S2
MKDLPTVKELLEAGVHFGHQTKRWNPKMAPYIFAEKNDIHIIDLSKTLEQMRIAVDYLEKVAQDGGTFMFVGTKRQAQEVVENVAKELDAYYVVNRWVGGLLTNFTITKTNINKMIEIEEGMVKGFDNRTKQEVSLLGKELERLQRLYGGIRGLQKKPSVMILADPHHERLAVKEAKRLNIPVVAVVDTNCDPDEVDYPIPGNDDAIKSITLFFNVFAQAIAEGKAKIKKEEPKTKEQPKTEMKAAEPKKEKEEKKEVKKEEAKKEEIKKEEKPKAKKTPAKAKKTT